MYTRLLSLALIVCASLASTVFAATPNDSLYSVPFTWRDQNGQALTLDTLKGKPVVLTMAYTKCKTACPVTMGRFKRIAAALETRVPDAQFVIVSLDPKRDTPETMAQFKKHYRLEEDSWHLLTGSEADVRKLSVLIGYSYQTDTADGEIAHSNRIVALDREGQIVAELDGLDSELQPFIEKVAPEAGK